MVYQTTSSGLDLSTRHCLERLRAVVLLAGSVRATRLQGGIGRSMLDLPVGGEGKTLLMYWQEQAGGLGRAAGLKRLEVRVLVDREAREPGVPGGVEGVVVSVERDPLDYRGTGGVLKDLARGYGEDEYILVANGHQLLLQDLAGLAVRVVEEGGIGADVVVTSHRDGSASSLMLVRCGVLGGIAGAGFVDMKEQGLPLIAKHHRVEVVELARPSGMVIRSVGDYVNALRRHHRKNVMEGGDPWAEDWAATFSIVEEGAQVASGARVHDSVVLRGAKVEAGAVVVRSVVCPGAVVGRGKLVAEDLIEGQSAHRRGRAA